MKVRSLFLSLLIGLSAAIPVLHAQERVTRISGPLPGMRISGGSPVYPLAARAAGIEGTVSIKGTISAQGRMENIVVLSGPLELRQAAVDWATTWVYRPNMHEGHAIAVDTTANVVFHMGDNPTEKSESQAKAKAQLAQAGTQINTETRGPVH